MRRGTERQTETKDLTRFRGHYLNQLISMVIKLQKEINEISKHLF